MGANSENRSYRNRSIRKAVGASLVSKGTTMLLQFVSLPLAARVLGREEFGVYSTISLAVFIVTLLQLGVGPALARELSEASAKGDRSRQGSLYLSGALLVSGLALAGLLVAALLITFVPVPVLFGENYRGYADVMRPALWIGAFLMAGQIIVAMTDRVREGYMEASYVNFVSATGNILGAIGVFVGVRYWPSVPFLLVAVFGPNILVRALSTLFLLKKRPWLIRGARPDRATALSLVTDGLSFSATSVLVYFVEFVLCALAVGRIAGPGDVAIFQVLMFITTSFAGMLIMVGNPLWAAIVDAKVRGDHDWMISATRRFYQYLAALTAISGLVLIGFGPWALPFIYGSEFGADRLLFIGHALFLFSIGWRHVNRYLAIGLGLVHKSVLPILLGLGTGLALGVFGLSSYGLWALYLGLAIGNLVFPGVILPRLIWKSLVRTPGRKNTVAGKRLSGITESVNAQS